MKLKSIFLILIALFTLQQNFSQDLMYLKNGDELDVKINEITLTKVKYHMPSITNGPEYTVSKSNIILIKYGDGRKDIFPCLTKYKSENNLTFNQGKQDAKMLYNDNKPLLISFAVTSVFSPAGLVTGIVTSTIPPKIENIEGIDTELMENIYYKNGFKRKAQGKKIRKIALGFGLGIPINALLLVFLLSGGN